jgi:hypothetical protein
MKCCCPICTRFVVVQYTTRPAGKMNPQIPNRSGMIFVRVCCCWLAPGGEARCIWRCW